MAHPDRNQDTGSKQFRDLLKRGVNKELDLFSPSNKEAAAAVIRKARDSAPLRPRPSDFTSDPDLLELASEVVKKEDERFARMPFEQKYETNIKSATELALYDAARSYGWLGEDVAIHPVSSYDYVANSTSAILTFDKAPSRPGLAINLQFEDLGDRTANIEEEIIRIRQSILDGDLPHVQFYQANGSSLTNVEIPRATIILPKSTANHFLNTWGTEPQGITEKRAKDRALSRHYIHFMILLQAKRQCEYFANYASNNPELKHIEAEYLYALGIINTAIEGKERELDEVESLLVQTPVYKKLLRITQI